MTYKRIGILGGMGAAASVRFYDLLVKECQRRGAKQDSDFPQIVLFNMNSKGMDETGISDDFVMKHDLFNGIVMMNRWQCDVILIACNSAHVHLEYLSDFSDAPILNIVKKACEACYGLDKVGVLCSRTSGDIYKEYLSKMGVDMVETNFQMDIDELIGLAISQPYLSSLYHRLNEQIKLLLDKGAEKVILGCTELGLIPCKQYKIIHPEELVIQEVLDA
jgi:aspartate racemase